MQIECARIKHQDGIEDLCRFQVAVSRSFVKCGAAVCVTQINLSVDSQKTEQPA
jgi:hypothetical protein